MAVADETLYDRVKAFLRAWGYTEDRHAIDVGVTDGIVVLSGWVAEGIDVRVVGMLVRQVDGIAALRNLLHARQARAGGVVSEPPTVSTDRVARLTVGLR